MLESFVKWVLGLNFVSKRFVVAILTPLADIVVAQADKVGITLSEAEVLAFMVTSAMTGIAYIISETKRASQTKEEAKPLKGKK